MNSFPLPSVPDSNNEPKITGKPSLYNLEHLDLPVHIKSCFSDEEDSKSDDETGQDILEIAEKQDKLKASRDDLVLRMSMSGKAMSAELKEDLKKQDQQSKAPHHIHNESNHFQRKAVSDNNIPRIEGPKAEYLNPDPSDEDIEGNLDDNLSEEPPKAVMPENLTVQSISDECKTKQDVNKAVGVVPEAKFGGALRNQMPFGPLGGLPIVEGFLKKKSTNLLKLWMKRYYVLKNKKLYYYENESKEIKAGVLDFDLISVKLEAGKDKKELKIIPVGGSRKFRLKATNEEECKKWFEALEKHVKVSRGYLSSICKTAKVRNFWKSDRIAQSAFLRQADTGDILIFRTKNIGARIQRSFTLSEYDHVALLLRFHTGDIVLFEASGKTGVGLCRWSTFVQSKWHQLYSKIVYRKLNIQRSEEIINGIENFVKYSVGKKYKVSATKLLKKKVVEDETKENRTFFCSELVAACYKRVGLLPQDISAARYLPGTFAAEKKLQLTNNAKLGDEYLIDFDI